MLLNAAAELRLRPSHWLLIDISGIVHHKPNNVDGNGGFSRMHDMRKPRRYNFFLYSSLEDCIIIFKKTCMCYISIAEEFFFKSLKPEVLKAWVSDWSRWMPSECAFLTDPSEGCDVELTRSQVTTNFGGNNVCLPFGRHFCLIRLLLTVLKLF